MNTTPVPFRPELPRHHTLPAGEVVPALLPHLPQGSAQAALQSLHALVAKLASQRQLGPSSSIDEEQATEMLENTLYTLGYFLKTLPPASALERLGEADLPALYHEGGRALRRAVSRARALLESLRRGCFETKSEYFNAAPDVGIPLFLGGYDALDTPAKSPNWIDYPLSMAGPHRGGIEYLLDYLRGFAAENGFLRYFSPAAVHRVLLRHEPEYTSLPVNLFSPVAEQALLCAAGGRDIPSLEATPAQDIPRLVPRLESAAQALCRCTGASEEAAHRIRAAARALKTRLQHTEALTPAAAPAPKAFHLKEKPPMATDALHRLARELGECRYFSDKRALVGPVQNLSDLTALLDSGCFTGPECGKLYATLPEEAIAGLLARFPSLGRDALPIIEDADRPWQKTLLAFVEELEPPRRKHVQTMAAGMVL